MYFLKWYTTTLDENIKKNKLDAKDEIRQHVIESAKRRLKGVTDDSRRDLLALLPVLPPKKRKRRRADDSNGYHGGGMIFKSASIHIVLI